MPSPLPSQVPSAPLPGSPYPILPPLEFDFYEALRQVVAGKKVTRTSWNDPTNWLELRAGILHIHYPNSPDGIAGQEWHVLKVSDGDILAVDWTILV
jgi:hypothetical protein